MINTGEAWGLAVWSNTPFGKVRAVRALRMVIDAGGGGRREAGSFCKYGYLGNAVICRVDFVVPVRLHNRNLVGQGS